MTAEALERPSELDAARMMEIFAAGGDEPGPEELTAGERPPRWQVIGRGPNVPAPRGNGDTTAAIVKALRPR